MHRPNEFAALRGPERAELGSEGIRTVWPRFGNEAGPELLFQGIFSWQGTL